MSDALTLAVSGQSLYLDVTPSIPLLYALRNDP